MIGVKWFDPRDTGDSHITGIAHAVEHMSQVEEVILLIFRGEASHINPVDAAIQT